MSWRPKDINQTELSFEEIKELVGEHNINEMWGEGLNPMDIFHHVLLKQIEITADAMLATLFKLAQESPTGTFEIDSHIVVIQQDKEES